MEYKKWEILAILCLSFNVFGVLKSKFWNRFFRLFSYDKYVLYEPSLLNNSLYLIFAFSYVWWLCKKYDIFIKKDKDNFFCNSRNNYDPFSSNYAPRLFDNTETAFN